MHATIPPTVLLARLDAIGASLAQLPDALGLIALGSVGLERERLDAYSDLDFFVVVEDHAKARYLSDLDWLAAAGPGTEGTARSAIAYHLRNTADGYKLLYADGIFCEFAVFTRAELSSAATSGARIVWERHGAALQLPEPVTPAEPPALSWQLGEALTNLYVGLGRLRRGEQLSAARFIQQYAVDRVLALAAQLEPAGSASSDPFAPERRVEQRYPGLALLLPQFVQGYERSAESALAMLTYLEAHWEVNPQLAAAIRARATALRPR